MAIGTAAISGVPLLAGFWSKDEILLNAFAGKTQGGLGGPLYWAVAFITAGMTAFYMTRMMVKTFAGAPRFDAHVASHLHESPLSMTAPLGILSVLSIGGGFMNAGPIFGIHAFEHWLEPVVKPRELSVHSIEMPLMIASIVLSVGVCGWAWLGFRGVASWRVRYQRTPPDSSLRHRGKSMGNRSVAGFGFQRRRHRYRAMDATLPGRSWRRRRGERFRSWNSSAGRRAQGMAERIRSLLRADDACRRTRCGCRLSCRTGEVGRRARCLT